jgi:ATP-dependent helicase/DNAse subunit B
VQYRLLRTVIDQLPLTHYAPLKAKPGFIQVAGQLIAELKSARIAPNAFAVAVAQLGDEPRLRELADIYSAYQTQLQAQQWADRVGLTWLAVEALSARAPAACRRWPLLIVDGFDDFTPI